MYRSKTAMEQLRRKHTQNDSKNLGQPSSFSKLPIPPSFRSTSHQNSSSTSTQFQSSYKPNFQHPSSSFHSTPFEANLHESTSSSQPSSPGPVLQPSSSANSEHDDNLADENELKLLTEVEITDAQGSILRTQKIKVKDIYKLSNGEKILVHVNEFGQPIKAAGGVCTRFMTLLLKQPKLCPPEARDWPEAKACCGVRLLGELRRKFILPQTDTVDKVIFAIFDEKFRTFKHRFKKKLFRMVANKLDEANNMANHDAHETHYTEEELLQALDLVEAPSNFVDHQWELYKSHLRAPITKKLSQYGKKARANQVHIHTTGAMSYARKKDEFKSKNKREANELEFFDMSHLMKKGSYVTDSSRELMDRAREEFSKRSSEVVDGETQSEIERDIMRELMGPDKPGRARGHGAGVTKSQVTKFSYDLRKLRSDALTNHNRVLLDKVESQSNQIESQSKKIHNLEQKVALIALAESFKFLKPRFWGCMETIRGIILA